MNSNYDTTRQWADKVAFLGLFVISLLIARFVVVLRSSFELSEPIELDYGGLSVSIPLNKGWQGLKEWKYQQDAFTLGSFLSVAPDSVEAFVSCQYQLAPVMATPEVLFDEKAFASGGMIVETGRIDVKQPASWGGVVAIDWAHINGRGTASETFFGIVQLPSNHQLEIEVYQAAGNAQLAAKLFKSVAESLEFEENVRLENSSNVIEEIKRKGVSDFLGYRFSEEPPFENKNRETFFLIKEAGGRLIGFTMEVLGSHFASAYEAPKAEEKREQSGDAAAVPAPEAQLSILAGSFYYIRQDRYDHRQAALFQSDNDISEFLWKSETYGPTDKIGVEMVLGKDGILTVRKFDGRLEERDCQISSVAIPDVFGELLFSQMLESNQKEIFVDIISANSKIIPTLVSRVEQSGPAVSRNLDSGTAFFGEEAAYIFQLDFLDGRGYSERVYLNDAVQVFGRLLQQEEKYVLERTSAENILRQFPEHGRYILQRKKEVFEQDQMPTNSE